MAALPVSVVIVSRERPDALDRCLTGLSQLDYPQLEIVVVACPAGLARVSHRKDADSIKTVSCDEANISVARNLGISAAAGDIIAFIDDDAVPEPLWLQHLIPAFDTSEVAAAGGYVIGRNGISLQWGARSVDHAGNTAPISLPSDKAAILHPTAQRAIKTEGTNMAIRRDVLAGMGGFDPAFRFYLDETDLNLRLARAGHATAIVPAARVHHGFAASIRRRPDRTPRDLTEIGASYAAFLRKHCPKNQHASNFANFFSNQRQRLLRHLQSGQLDPMDVIRLQKGLKTGLKTGEDRELGPLPDLPKPALGFLPYPVKTDAKQVLIAGRKLSKKALLQRAKTVRDNGDIPFVICLSHSSLYHQISFRPDGIWLQTGGIYGRSDRGDPLFTPTRFSTRITRETQRLNSYWKLSPAN